MELIPAFGYDGARVRYYRLSEAEWLVGQSRAVPRRNKRGELLAIVFRSKVGGDPMLRTMRPGQKYSFLEHVGDQTPARTFGFQKLGGVRADYETWRSLLPGDVSPDGKRNQAPGAAVAPQFS